MNTGRVIRTTGSWYDVMNDVGDVISCRPAGKLRLKGYRSTNPVAVGDLVDFTSVEDGTGVIAESNGQAAALRLRAGELMANGYARRLSNESESQWNAHVKSMTKLRLRWLLSQG